jgi:hypothetical protein
MNSYKIYSPHKFVSLHYVRVKLPIQIFITCKIMFCFLSLMVAVQITSFSSSLQTR